MKIWSPAKPRYFVCSKHFVADTLRRCACWNSTSRRSISSNSNPFYKEPTKQVNSQRLLKPTLPIQCRGLSQGHSKRQLKEAQYAQHQDFSGQPDGSLYQHHRPTNLLQKGVLALGSAAMAFVDPTRSDMVATLGEVTGQKALERMRLKMLNDPEGIRVLTDRPIIDSTVLDLKLLSELPVNTFGRCYADFMISNGITSDTRDAVQFVDDAELAYVMKRYRQVHDMFHTLLGLPSISVPSELGVKWFEAVHLGLPMSMLSALAGPFSTIGKLPVSADQRAQILQMIPWAAHNGMNARFLMNVYFEEKMEMDLDELRKELNIIPAPFVLL